MPVKPRYVNQDTRARRQRSAGRRRIGRGRRPGRSGLLTVGVAAGVVSVALVTAEPAGLRVQPAGRFSRATPRLVLLPRGGRTVLPGHLVVAYYGIVGTSNILGKTNNPEADAAGVERQAHAFARFGVPVQPAFELVTTIASPDPGPDGSYSSPIAPATVARYLAAAHRHKLLLILDFQPGRGEFKADVLRYAHFLLDPAVGVGLDPEWKLTSSQVPDQAIGSASAASINAVSSYLSRLVARHRLPQKLLIIHEFRTSELPDRQNVLIRPGLATVLQMDGLGPVSTKLASFRAVTRNASRFHIGFKVFLRRAADPVLMTPQEIMALRPRPAYISYQ